MLYEVITVATAYDKMKLLDVDASGFFDSLTFPITLGGIYAALCSFAGVSTTSTVFINSTRSFSEAPIDADGITAKEILQWIAEAACSFARMNRNGDFVITSYSIHYTKLYEQALSTQPKQPQERAPQRDIR